MANRWPSHAEHVFELKDLQASAMAVDCLGNWCLLAGRKNLAFVNLNKSSPAIKVTRQSKWDIGCVQWNMHASCAYRFVTACNQRLDVFDFRDASASHLCSMKAHSRTVSDIDWSPFDVNVVASCSVDTFTYFWDVRDAKKPVKFFQTVTGAYQVKWNKVTNNLFATTHDGDVRIWDPRKGNTPIQYIAAHPSKIHGLDWSNTDQNKLVTASQDCTIRLWDFSNPQRSEALINSRNPVWRARYTPFGEGIVSVVVPQLRRGEDSLYLWHPSNQQDPVHTFSGHTDVILEFQWRKKQDNAVDHHLVTWSKDQTLRVWKVDPGLQKLCGHHIQSDAFDLHGDTSSFSLLEEAQTESTISSKVEFSQDHKEHLGRVAGQPDSQEVRQMSTGGEETGGLAQLFSTTSSSPSLLSAVDRGSRAATPVGPGGGASVITLSSMMPGISLKQEMDEVQRARLPGIKLDQADFVKRTCVFKLLRGSLSLDVQLWFPDNYPMKIAPRIIILASNLDSDAETRCIKVYNEVCSRHVKQQINCVEPCLRHMYQVMDSTSLSPLDRQAHEDRKVMLEKKFAVEKVQQVRSPTSPVQAASVIPKYPTGMDHRIPFPRTCGARFCSTDRLVTFGVPVSLKKVHEENEVTPRALCDLIVYMRPPQSPWVRNQPSPYAAGPFSGSSHSSSEGVSISSFYVEKTSKPRHQRHHQSQSLYKSFRLRDSLDMGKRMSTSGDRDIERSSRRQQKVGLIKIYDTTCINPVSRDLAERYKLDLSDVQSTCEYNAGVARDAGRMDLAQVWQLVGIMSDPSVQPVPNADRGPPFAYSAFGRPLLKRIMEHYGRMRDVQTMAMLCCIFWDKNPSHGHRDGYILDLQAEPGTSSSTGVTHLSRNDSRTSLEYNAAAAANQGEVTMATSSDSGYYVLPSTGNTYTLSTLNQGSSQAPPPDQAYPTFTVTSTNSSTSQSTRPTTLGGNFWSLLTSPAQPAQLMSIHSHSQWSQSSLNLIPEQQQQQLHRHSQWSQSSLHLIPEQQQQQQQLHRALSAGASIKAMFLPVGQAPPAPPPPTPSSPHASQPTTPTTPVYGLVSRSKAGSKVKGEVIMEEVASQPNLAAAFRAAVMKSKRSSSWSEPFDDFKMLEDKDSRERDAERERVLHHNNSKMLDPDQWYQHEQIKQSYANLLFKWGLLNQRSQVLKHTVASDWDVKSIEVGVTCWNCSEQVRGVQCTRCFYPALKCSICHIGVRGAANLCMACGHGGHMEHLAEWFNEYSVCPTGCGCRCLEENMV